MRFLVLLGPFIVYIVLLDQVIRRQLRRGKRTNAFGLALLAGIAPAVIAAVFLEDAWAVVLVLAVAYGGSRVFMPDLWDALPRSP